MIRLMRDADWPDWKVLWDAYLDFYRTQLDAQTTRTTFSRLCERTDGMCGLLAVGSSGTAVGFAHLVFHAATWTTTQYCYIEDLFVARSARGSDTGRDLILAAFEEADRQQASRVYWHTQEFNAAARSLYDQVGHPTSFIVYQR